MKKIGINGGFLGVDKRLANEGYFGWEKNYLQNPAGYLLDFVSTTSLVAAWSMRRLNSNYLTNAVIARRSNDNNVIAVGFIGQDFDTATFQSYMASNSAFLTTWYDQSGNVRTLTQGSNGNQPRLRNVGVNEAINGRIAARGINANSTSIAGSIGSVSTSNFTIVLVLSLPAYSSGSRRIVSCNQSSNSDTGLASTFNINLSGSNQIVVENAMNLYATVAANTPTVLTVMWNGTSLKIRGNGAEIASTNNTNTLTINTITFVGLGQVSDSVVAESIVYARTLTTGELQTIEKNMGAYYGITVA